MLELKDVTLTLGERRLFEKLSLIAPSGQMTCITGPADCGKTALVQVMLGFLLPDEGLVSIDGELLTPLSAPAFRKMMAYLPQEREVTIEPVETDTTGLEAVWTPQCRWPRCVRWTTAAHPYRQGTGEKAESPLPR